MLIVWLLEMRCAILKISKTVRTVLDSRRNFIAQGHDPEDDYGKRRKKVHRVTARSHDGIRFLLSHLYESDMQVHASTQES